MKPPTLSNIAEFCKGNEKYRDTLVCRVVTSLVEGDTGVAAEAVRSLLQLHLEHAKAVQRRRGGGAVSTLYASTGPLEHWQDSLRWAEGAGLLPWACGVSPDSPMHTHFGGFARASAGVLQKEQLLLPLVLYKVQGGPGRDSVAAGLGMVVWLDTSPLRERLWSSEECPPRGSTCYTARWYMVTLLLACSPEDIAEGRLGGCNLDNELSEVLKARVRGCIHSLHSDAVNILQKLLGLSEFERFVESAARLAAYVKQPRPAQPVARQPLWAAAGGEWDRQDPRLLAQAVLEQLGSLGVLVPRRLVEAATLLIVRGNALLLGPPGTGKTLLAKAIAEAAGALPVVATCHAGWTRAEFVGGPYPGPNGGLVWRSGHLVRALAEAVKGRRVLLLLDEVNRADVDKVFGEFFTAFPSPWAGHWDLAALCSTLKAEAAGMEVDEAARIVLEACRDGAIDAARERLRIVATMNTVDYATVFSVGEAFGRRFLKLEFKLPASEEKVLEEIEAALKTVNAGKLEEVKERLARLVAELRREHEETLLGVAVTQLPLGPAFIRDVVEAAAALLEAGIEKNPVCATLRAIESALPVTTLIEDEPRKRLSKAINKAFGEEVRQCLRITP